MFSSSSAPARENRGRTNAILAPSTRMNAVLASLTRMNVVLAQAQHALSTFRMPEQHQCLTCPAMTQALKLRFVYKKRFVAAGVIEEPYRGVLRFALPGFRSFVQRESA